LSQYHPSATVPRCLFNWFNTKLGLVALARLTLQASRLLSFSIITNKLTVASNMSSYIPGQTDIPSSHFKPILDAAWSHAFKKNAGQELLDGPLATEVQQCDSVDAVLTIFQG
jgi:hypothetical protein